MSAPGMRLPENWSDFHTVPQPGKFGHDTWLDDGWKNRSGVNVEDVQRISRLAPADANRGPATIITGPPGANLFGNRWVAVDAMTENEVVPANYAS